MRAVETSAFFDLFGASGGLMAGELAAAEGLAVAHRLLADDLLAVAIGPGHIDRLDALLDGTTVSVVRDGLGRLALIFHGAEIPAAGPGRSSAA